MAKIASLAKFEPERRRLPLRADPMSQGSTANHIDPLSELSELGEVEDSPAGTTLFRQGHRPSLLRLIVSGLVKTIRLEGTTEALVSIRGPGWVLGLAPACLERPYSTSGITATPCSLRSISPQALKAQIAASPGLSAWGLRLFLAQGRRDEILRAEMAVYAAPERLARTLHRLAHLIEAPQRHGHVELAMPITHGELAQLVGISTQHLSRLLATFEAAGKLRRRRGVLLLPLGRWPRLDQGRPVVPD